jgi:signal transduction histidine kinase/CheY-like chemotaxis protein
LIGQKSYDTLSFFSADFTTEEAEKEFIEAIHANANANKAHEKAKAIAHAFVEYSIDKNDPKLKKSSCHQLGLIYFHDTQYDSALICLTQAKDLAIEQNDTSALINIKRSIGAVYLSNKQNELAINNFNESLELSKTISDSISMAKALNNLSILSSQAQEYENALNYLKRALDLKIAFAPKPEQISTLINIGINYTYLGSLDKAEGYLNRAKNIAIEHNEQKKLAEIWNHLANTFITMKDFDHANMAFNESIKISTQLNDQVQLALSTKLYSEHLMNLEKWQDAESNLESIIDQFDDSPTVLTEVFYDLGKIAYETKDINKAEKYLNKAVSISGVSKGETLAKSYNLLSLISYLNKNYEFAYHHLRISNIMNDSITRTINTDRLRELRVKYNSYNDSETIENLIEIAELKEKEKEKSKFYFIITFSLFIITLAVAITLARQASFRRKQSNELSTQIDENLKKTKDLIEAHKLAEEGLKVKSEFIAMVSHEIRTPMNAIIGMSSLLADTKLDDYQRNYLNNISISSNNLLILLNDILDFSRVEAGKVSIKLQPADLNKELKHVVNMFEPLAQEKDLGFEVSLDKKIPSVAFIDAPRLRQVVVNLLSNAIKFTHDGFVKLSVEVIKTEPTLNGSMVTLRFEVKDSGIGVPKNKQNEIFSSFNQLDSKVSRQYSGVGLGLSISQGILGMMGSSIQLESEFARGSTFWFHLKIKAEKDSKIPIPSNGNTKVRFDKELGITCPLKILIAEDNEINQKLLQINLNKMGYNPMIVSNGQEALDQIKIQQFDIVFMDVQMPVLDGVAATKEIVRMYGKNKPIIIAVTANAMGTDKQSYIQAGMDDYISKPFTTSEIENCLRNWYVHIYSQD